MLNEFLDKKGFNLGNINSIFYTSYVFFEKIRIKDNKLKATFKEEIKDI